MGTSVEQIDRTYGHLLPDSIGRTLGHDSATFTAAVGRKCSRGAEI